MNAVHRRATWHSTLSGLESGIHLHQPSKFRTLFSLWIQVLFAMSSRKSRGMEPRDRFRAGIRIKISAPPCGTPLFGFTKKIGEQKEREYLERAQYGNEDPTGKSPFWVEGNLQISAHEQIGFLRKLYQNELPFRVADQRLVKDLILIEAGRDWILRGKTGWSGTIGWWVGWVEHATGPVFFALNIDTPGRMEDLPKREGITRAILESLGALKPDAERGGGRQSASRPESK